MWDVTSVHQALTLSALGVDALIGDDPALLGAAVVPERGLRAAVVSRVRSTIAFVLAVGVNARRR